VEHHCQCKFGETTADGNVSLVQARCVGSCGLAPVAVVDGQVAGKLTAASSLDRIKQWQDEEVTR
jgi:bidirectional [NiFe] hydrogenase diaphorase subunit